MFFYNYGACDVMVIVIQNERGGPILNHRKAVCLFHRANTLGKGMNLTILIPAIGKTVGLTELFSLGISTGREEEKLWIQTC